MENTREEVKKVLEGGSEESSTSEENVSSSPEVKESTEENTSEDKSEDTSEDTSEDKSEEEKESDDLTKDVEIPKSEKDVEDLKKQINNLNTALREERGYSKKKIEEMTQKLEESTAVLDKFKQAFSSKEEPQTQPYATPAEIDKLVEQKLQKIKEEQKQQEKVEEYKKQIKELETKWDGKDGKPKYDDSDVLAWQKDNNKVYLSPEEAFFQMKRNDILDYEVKQRMSTKKSAVDVEKTSSESRDDSRPDEKSLAETDTRSAVLQAMEDISKEM